MALRRLGFFAAAMGLLLIGCLPRVCSAGPAPGLTLVRVADVMSSGYSSSWDYVPPGAVSTPHDHRGPVLYVAFLEQGYANNNRHALFNGQPMTWIESVPVYGPYPYIVGYLQVYGYQGSWTSGTVTYQAQSLVSPYRILSTRLTIR